MVRSLGLIAVVIAVTLIFVPGLVHPSKSQQFAPVDYSDYVSGFHELTGHAALTPTLPTGWAANAASLTGGRAAAHLHIGFVTPNGQYAGLEESIAPATVFVPSVLGRVGATVTGRVSVDGTSWQTSTSSRGEYSLVHTVGTITVVITGSATDAQLQLVAASLR
jgi:hypothetical protein